MNFYSLIEKAEFDGLIKQAKKSCMKEALAKLKDFEPMNQSYFKALMPEGTPDVLINKRVNKLKMKKRQKDLKRLLG